MRKRIYVSILIMFMAIFLAGCITIPLGDGVVIKISEAGIEFVKTENDDEEVDPNNTGKATSGAVQES